MPAPAIKQSPTRPLIGGAAQERGEPPALAEGVWTGNNVVVCGGARLAPGAILDHNVIVEQDVSIGPRSLLCYAAQVCEGASIGSDCVIGGFIGERSTVGDNCRIFGSLVHRHPRAWLGWDEPEAMADGPRLGDEVFIAFGAVIVGDITVGDRVYVGANAVVTVDVPEGTTIGPLVHWSNSK